MKDDALPRLAAIAKREELSAERQKAIRMVRARLLETDSRARTLEGLCSPSMDRRLETFVELKYINGGFALSAIRYLFGFPALLPWQRPEGDIHDMPFGYRALRLLAELRPDSPATKVHWINASSHKRLPEYIRPSMIWLGEEARSTALEEGLVPTCLRR